MGEAGGKTMGLVLGRYDDPDNQTQVDFSYDLYKSNLAIFGLAMSGKTTLLKTLLIRLHQVARITLKERIYILDFSNNLRPYKELPYTVAYFDASQEENVRRVFQAVEERFTHNVSRLPGRSYIQCPEQKRPAHVTFVLDGLNTFLAEERYTSYHEILLKLARDGLSKGVTVVFTASDTAGGIAKLLTSFGSIITLDFPRDKCTELYNTKIEKPISNPGRGMVNRDGHVYEFQAYFPYNADDPTLKDNNEADEIFIRTLTERLRKCPPPEGSHSADKIIRCCAERRMRPFDTELTRDQWKDYTGTSWKDYLASGECGDTDLVAGLDYYSLVPVKFDLRTAHSIAIYGRRAFGKTNLLGLILERLRNIPDIRFVVWEDAREGLSRNANTVKRILDEMRKRGRLEEFRKREDFEKYLLANYRGEFRPARSNSRSDSSRSDRAMPSAEEPIVPTPDALNAQREKGNVVGGRPAPPHPAENPPDITAGTNPGNPFTVFLIQSQLFYQTGGMWVLDQFIPRVASFVNTHTAENEKLFLFSDAQPITDNECSVAFNNCLTHVFLLNDILRYINNRGQKSVFGTQDPEDIKERFGKCDLGDGFYYDIEKGEIQKVRFLKQQEITDGGKE